MGDVDTSISQFTKDIFMTGLGLFNLAWDFTVELAGFTGTLLKNIHRSFEPSIFVFFTDSYYAYRLADLQLNAPGSAEVEWYYDAERKLFFQPNGEIHGAKHFPYLSAEIKYNDLSLYDISEFIEPMHWCGQEAPSADHILAVWMMQKGIVLSKRHLSLSVINEEGDTVLVPLRSGV